MKFLLFSNLSVGYGMIMGVVILAVLLYTVIRLRKQVKKTRKEEERKKNKDL